MGTGEETSPAKPSKPTSSAQENQTVPSYPDWSSSMQPYYGAGAAHPFFATTVASPTPHPYLWGSQHPLIPPYGTPVPYPALYPAGGVYAHPPNMATGPSMGQANVELEGKPSDGKDRASNKKSKGTLGSMAVVGVKGGENGKSASGSGNDGATQSAESGSEGSSNASDENNQQEYSATASKKRSLDLMLADGANAQNNTVGVNLQASVPGNPIVSLPTTNLNMGMDLWSVSPAGAGAVRPHASGVSPAVAPAAMVAREGMMTDQWIQDDRELKRQKRKQSNRESARRSRLRKQAECEELQARVETLTNENQTLREEMQRLSEECEKLASENNSIKEELTRLWGPDAVSKLENNNSNQLLHQSPNGENC
uniref:BZIP10 n=1 Tax=Diospyros kaki TaxID=35925 RepID=A0A5P9PBF9_DIOKA|nr:bZIP10 [Diospyros kaki]